MELTNNSSNTVAMYLSDSVTISGAAYFLFKIWESHGTPIYFTAANTTSYPVAFDQFEFILTGCSDVNLTAGTICIQDGTYNLDVYQTSAYTNSISEAIGEPIHNDIVRVSGTTSYSQVQYTYSGGTNTIYEYSPSI